LNEDEIVIESPAAGQTLITGFSGGTGSAYDFGTIKYSGMPGIKSYVAKDLRSTYSGPTIVSGPLRLPEGRNCKVFDITGREVHTLDPIAGIYFVEIDGGISQKIIKIR